MKPANGINPSSVPYFSLEEYVDKIKLNDTVLSHLEDTNVNFDRYISKMASFDDDEKIIFWLETLINELQSSMNIENHHVDESEIYKNNLYFDKIQISHNRIKQLHHFLTNLDSDFSQMEDYRSNGKEVRVSVLRENGEEVVFWNGANSEDVKKFMDDYIKVYKSNSLSLINSNPFLKSALMSLLFVRIHPFTDGNGRTSRMIYNIKFTDLVNKIYGTNLKLCPLNLSNNIYLYKPQYVQRINDIYFDLEHDCNDEINKWLDFMLTRADEMIYYNEGRLDNFEAQMGRGNYISQGQVLNMKLDKLNNK